MAGNQSHQTLQFPGIPKAAPAAKGLNPQSRSANSNKRPAQVFFKVDQHKQRQTKFFISETDRHNIIEECGDQAFMLYDYFLRMASIGTQPFDDTTAADYFKWTEDKAKRYRLKLTRAGWFKITKGTLGGQRIPQIVYYIGKNAVAQS